MREPGEHIIVSALDYNHGRHGRLVKITGQSEHPFEEGKLSNVWEVELFPTPYFRKKMVQLNEGLLYRCDDAPPICKAVYVSMTSAAGDTHESLVGVFDDRQRLNAFLENVTAKDRSVDFLVRDYEPPLVNPTKLP